MALLRMKALMNPSTALPTNTSGKKKWNVESDHRLRLDSRIFDLTLLCVAVQVVRNIVVRQLQIMPMVPRRNLAQRQNQQRSLKPVTSIGVA